MKQTILIIGGTSGLGRRLAELYASEGHKVGIVGRRGHLLHEIEQSFPDQVTSFPYDISLPDCTEKITSFINALGGIDLLILSASIVIFNPQLSPADEQQTVSVNISGYAAVLNSAYHYFGQKKSGHIVGITSIAAARGNKTAIAYNASKAFQSSYLEGLRLQLQNEETQVAVTELVPGYVDTEMARGNRLFWVASVEKAAQQAKKAINRKARRAFITKRWWLVYQVYRFLPGPIYSYLMNSKIKLQKRD